MPQDNNEKMHNDLIVNRGRTSTDLTTNLVQRMAIVAVVEATDKVRQIVVQAGGVP